MLPVWEKPFQEEPGARRDPQPTPSSQAAAAEQHTTHQTPPAKAETEL